MEENFKFRIILHFSNLKNARYISIFKKKKKLEGKEINFEIPKDKFNSFQIFIPTKLFLLDALGKILANFTLNLLKEKNTYHLFSGGNMELYELLFYNEEKIELIVDNEKIEECDSFSKFKRYSLINIGEYEIKVNGQKINLEDFLTKKGNSFQLSFYDINKKYIVSKRIIKSQHMNFQIFYEKYINNLNKYSSAIDELLINKEEFEKNLIALNESHTNIITKIECTLNLNLPKTELETLLNDENYLDFFYLYIKIYFSYYFSINNNKDFDDYKELFNYLKTFYNKLKNDKDCKIFEKISILFHLSELFKLLKSCNSFLKSNFHYIKVEKSEKNSVIDLAYSFLNEFIDNLNEESPSYFKLIEINSNYGYYNGNKVFIYDMINLSGLKNHLKELLPSVICFYSFENTENAAFHYPVIVGICVNESGLFENCEKFSLDKNCFNEKKYDTKNVAMKLTLNMNHECFGHIKFQIHSDFCEKVINETPKKCFDNKILKELVGINNSIKNDTINILAYNDKSNSGDYFESSFGKLPESKYYTSVYLKINKNKGNLIDHPELFYKKENLEKLQKYAYYKYLYEQNNGNMGFLKINDEKYKTFDLEQELEYLTKFYENYSKSKIINEKEKEEISVITDEKPKKLKKFIGFKRRLPKIKKNDVIDEIIKSDKGKDISEIKPKEKTKYYKNMDRKKLTYILMNKNLTFKQQKYYLNLLLEKTPKI